MEPWTLLQCEDGGAITVPDDWTDTLGALLELVEQAYGGDSDDDWSRDNPVLVEAAEKDCRIQVWRSYTKRDLEAEGIDWEGGPGTYYGPSGGGAKHITVLWCEQEPYDLGERAEEAQSATV